jgi:YegS/Rv2252/BmrU family lipid kinase
VIFANPIAGKGKGQRLANAVADRCRQHGWDAAVCFERPDTAPAGLLANATDIVSIGGDGTLRGVMERVTDAGSQPGPGVLVIPMGTANLMGRHLGVGLSLRNVEDRAAQTIQSGRRVQLDAGVVNGKIFLLMVGVGIDGQIVHAVDQVRKGPIGFTSYLRPAFETLAAYSYPSIQVEVDGQRVFDMRQAVAMVGNVPEYGTGFPILPAARSDDQVLDVIVLPARTASDLIHHFLAAAAGEHLHGEGVVYVKGKRVRVVSDQPLAAQADGDPAGFTPLEIDLLPVRPAFIVPP